MTKYFLINLIMVSAIIAAVANFASVYTEDALNKTQVIANQANIRQLTNAMELYYLDHETYPNAKDGSELITKLGENGYIKNYSNINFETFDYESFNNNQEYRLSLK